MCPVTFGLGHIRIDGREAWWWLHGTGREKNGETGTLIQEYVKKLYDAFQAKEPETY